VSKEVSRQESKKPVSMAHGAAMVAVGVVGALIAFWVLSSIVGIIFFIVKIAVLVGLVAGAFWVVNRLRK
jgi:cobalamin biosynthesis protein CobD/CbiB